MLDRITEIGNEAFKDNTALNTIIIPSSVKSIGDSFISGCTNLTSLTLNMPITPKISENAFSDAKENLTIYVPENSLNVYRQTFEDFNLTFLSIN